MLPVALYQKQKKSCSQIWEHHDSFPHAERLPPGIQQEVLEKEPWHLSHGSSPDVWPATLRDMAMSRHTWNGWQRHSKTEIFGLGMIGSFCWLNGSWFMVHRRPLTAHWACKGQVGCAIPLVAPAGRCNARMNNIYGQRPHEDLPISFFNIYIYTVYNSNWKLKSPVDMVYRCMWM